MRSHLWVRIFYDDLCLNMLKGASRCGQNDHIKAPTVHTATNGFVTSYVVNLAPVVKTAIMKMMKLNIQPIYTWIY